MSDSFTSTGPWMLGAWGAPAIPPSWEVPRVPAPKLDYLEPTKVRKPPATMADLARPQQGRRGHDPVVWETSSARIVQTLTAHVTGWAEAPISAAVLGPGHLRDLPLLTATHQVLARLGFTGEASLEAIASTSRSRLLAHEEGALALLDLSILLECWWPHHEDSPMHVASECATTLEDVAAAIVEEYIAYDGNRLDQRWVTWILRRFSWGMPGATLDEIGKEVGVTRERIRQVITRISQPAGSRVWPLPAVVSGAIESLHDHDYLSVQDVLLDAGFVTDDDWTPEEITELLRWLGYSQAAQALEGHFETAELAQRELWDQNAELISLIRAARSKMGVIRTDTVAGSDGTLLDQATVEQLLPVAYPRVVTSGPWSLVSNEAGTSLENAAGRQLGLIQPLAVSELYEGLDRERRRRSAPPLPDQDTVLELLARAGAVEVTDGLCTGPTVPTDPGTINAWLAALLQHTDGHVLHKELIIRAAIRDRLNLTSLAQYITYSYAVRSCTEPGLYRLVGVYPSADDLEYAAAVAEATRTPNALEWSATDDGLILAITVGSNMLSMNTISAPAALCQLWPDEGVDVECVCHRSFGRRISTYADISLSSWGGLLTHAVLEHHLREGSTMTLRAVGSHMHVTRIE
jgi:Sigma-70, region 4